MGFGAAIPASIEINLKTHLNEESKWNSTGALGIRTFANRVYLPVKLIDQFVRRKH